MSKLTAVLTLLLALTLPSIALADVISPEEDACTGKAAGDACEVSGTAGTCTQDKCSKLDYSNGTPPSTIEVDCLLCKEGGSGAPVQDDAGSTGGGEDTNGASPPPTTTDDDGEDGCAGSGGPLSLVSLLAGLGLFGLLIARRRA